MNGRRGALELLVGGLGLHAVGEELANSRQWPNWSSDSEFRAARDRTATERSAEPAKPGKGERG